MLKPKALKYFWTKKWQRNEKDGVQFWQKSLILVVWTQIHGICAIYEWHFSLQVDKNIFVYPRHLLSTYVGYEAITTFKFCHIKIKKKPFHIPSYLTYTRLESLPDLLARIYLMHILLPINFAHLQIQPKYTVRGKTYVFDKRIFDSRPFMYNNIFLKKIL